MSELMLLPVGADLLDRPEMQLKVNDLCISMTSDAIISFDDRLSPLKV
jgi:hypothetical protein